MLLLHCFFWYSGIRATHIVFCLIVMQVMKIFVLSVLSTPNRNVIVWFSHHYQQHKMIFLSHALYFMSYKYRINVFLCLFQYMNLFSWLELLLFSIIYQGFEFSFPFIPNYRRLGLILGLVIRCGLFKNILVDNIKVSFIWITFVVWLLYFWLLTAYYVYNVKDWLITYGDN